MLPTGYINFNKVLFKSEILSLFSNVVLIVDISLVCLVSKSDIFVVKVLSMVVILSFIEFTLLLSKVFVLVILSFIVFTSAECCSSNSFFILSTYSTLAFLFNVSNFLYYCISICNFIL